MAGRDIQIPFGPDKTGGIGIEPIPPEGQASDPFAEPTAADVAALDGGELPTITPIEPQQAVAPVEPMPVLDPIEPTSSTATVEPVPVAIGQGSPASASLHAPEGEAAVASSAQAQDESADVDYRPGGYTDEEATAEGVDEFQMSVLALKDSIDQSRELREREKDREELAEALEADHVELADRENILANYESIVAEQDAIIAQGTQQRDAMKSELSQVTVSLDQYQKELGELRAQHAISLQPLETELGRARSAADRAKNDERSRKSELHAAESELRRADEAAANTMALAKHQQSQTAYDEARLRSEQAKDQLAQAQKAYDDERKRVEQAEGPLERNVQDLTHRSEDLKASINQLGEQISSARKRRQYCDTVYQYPDETAKMRSEVEQAEAIAVKMDADNDVLRQRLAVSKKKARTAKIAIAVVIAIIIVFIICFVALSAH